MLAKGLRWRVGNGRDIRIRNKWLPTPSTYKVVSPVRIFDSSARVLMTEDEFGWNVDLVERIFLSFEAQTILGIPVNRFRTRDKLIWHETTTGQFTVRSTYHLAMSHRHGSDVASSSSGVSHIWKHVWDLSVPPRVKTFLWRVCHNILPTLDNLQKRSGTWWYLLNVHSVVLLASLFNMYFVIAGWQKRYGKDVQSIFLSLAVLLSLCWSGLSIYSRP